MRPTQKRMTKKQRRARKSKRTMRKRVQRVRKMRGGVILDKSPKDENYLTYMGTVVDKQGNTITYRDFLKMDEESWETIYNKLKEHAKENFQKDEILDKGYGGDNGNGMITVSISDPEMKKKGSTGKVTAKDLPPMEFKIGGNTYTMNFKVDFGN